MAGFPEDFVWGVATSSYQIEGAIHEDGRGESIWDRLASKPGAIADGTDGSVACDHYHRWETDLDIMQSLGVKSYRFSIAWPRIMPTGKGAPVQAGIDFYSRLVDGCLARGIDPMVTLYHWDLPQALDEAGGWPARDTARYFTDYADVMSRALGDRVRGWITHNEPWCISVLGYVNGEHAPGIKNDWKKALACAHHLNLSHGWSVPVIRENVRDAHVGITLNLVPAEPASQSAADIEACRKFDGFFNRWYLDPIYGRGYPEDRIADLIAAGELSSPVLPFVQPGDLDAIAVPTDFLGINYYSRGIIRSDAVPEAENSPIEVKARDDVTDMGWEVYPDALRRLLVDVHREYTPSAIYITENGAAYATGPDEDGRVRDVKRQAYLEGHIDACAQAIEAGVPLAGYFAWSLLDNFEWAFGYEKRFGLVYVDYETQKRTPKDSALWYRDVIANGGL